MANDREQELERLEKELLADMEEEDDLLADIPMQLLDTTPATWDDDGILQKAELYADGEMSEEIPEVFEDPEETGEDIMAETKKTRSGKKKEDKVVNILMIIASFLCIGIIGVLIYWMEVFLK